MRPCVLSAALLSLLVDGSHAFAPPKSTASPTASRLAAGNELSGMLSDYSSSAAAEVTSATAEKVAVAVSSAVTTPTPPAAPSLAAFINNKASVIDAARVAQDAADRAAAAAAAVATKGAAATKAAATVGAGGISLKATVGGAAKFPFQVDPSKANTESSFDALAKSKENLATMKANILGGVVPSKGSTGNLDIALPKFDSASITPAVTDIINSLHLKDYGGWYVAAAAAIFASLQRSAGAQEASAKFESELSRAREKASEAATAAGLAAEGATTAKNLALKMEKEINTDGIGALLESSRSKKVQMEKGMMEKDMLALKAEVSSLRSELATYKGGKKKKAAANTKTVKTEIEEAYPTKVVMETDPDEDARVIELLKALDNENRTRKNETVAKLEKKREEEAKAVAKGQKKAAAEAARLAGETKAKAAAKDKAAAKAKSAAAEKTAAEAARLAEEKKAKAAAADKAVAEATSAAAKRKRRTKGVETLRATAEGARKTAVKKTAQNKAKTGAPQKGATKTTTTISVKKQATKTTTKVSTNKSVVKKASRTYSSIDDWALLADSTLKRKTVVQLTEYLTEKGVTATNESGNSLKKAELLEAVKSL